MLKLSVLIVCIAIIGSTMAQLEFKQEVVDGRVIQFLVLRLL